VHFIINPVQDKVARVDETVSTATRILAYVPAASGIKDSYDGQVYVKCGQQSSNKIPFAFVPAMVYAALDISKTGVATMGRNSGKLIAPAGNRPVAADAVDACTEDCWGFDGSLISAKHIGGKFLANRGEDEYFQSYTLKNNWVVESINFGVIGDAREARAKIIEDKKGTTSPYVKIGWSNTPIYDAVQYVISYTIKGPEGVPFR
jgi:hypothetical protein